ncbi:hypothetical protein [Proteiniphilum sp. UBA5384]|uniref:hypothetical protein n=1 Tax=Proteiniphilum sp. UBA5384 TaxID=1947279 RepID=UPI0025DB8D4C|nr:hypothetical protein [Proteiniphilum sp. UBA5384]
MKTKLLTISLLLVISLCANCQSQFKLCKEFYSALPDSLTNKIINSLDKLLISIDNSQLDTTLVDTKDKELNRNFFSHLKGVDEKDTIPHYFQAQLINLYPVEDNQYLLTMSYQKEEEIGRIFTFLVNNQKTNITFANPLKYNTKFWKTTTIGTATYYYPDTIDTKRAELFNQKNISMARNLNLPVRNWDIYMCRNFQEALQLQGCMYDFSRIGVYNSGYIMDPKTLFTCMNDEDFSHDVLHIYASQIRERPQRNANGECGLAYYWGNAYHAGTVGKSPELDELVTALQYYLKSHEEVSLLELFEKSPNILAEYGYPWPIHLNRIISGIICREVEKQKGTEGINELLKCGRGNDNLFKTTEKLIGINRDNFNEEVYKLIFIQ